MSELTLEFLINQYPEWLLEQNTCTDAITPGTPRQITVFFSLLLLGVLTPADDSLAQEAEGEQNNSNRKVVTYEPDFFTRYNPVTALDMVNQLPGFKLEGANEGFFDDQQDVRGFAAAASNVLVNGKRPSTKSESMTDFLQRFAAEDVLHIKLIRGATNSADLDLTRGSVVANVILKELTGRGPAPWQVELNYEDGTLSPSAEGTISWQVGKTNYMTRAKWRNFDWNISGPEVFQSEFLPNETRDEIVFNDGFEQSLDIRAQTDFESGNSMRLNAQGNREEENVEELSQRTRDDGASGTTERLETFESYGFELGGDYEHKFSDRFAGKFIGLVNREYLENVSRLELDFLDGSNEVSDSFQSGDLGETIGRFELDWLPRKNHVVKIAAEAAHNFVDSKLELNVDDGAGPEPVEVPGANTKVTERRIEGIVTDSLTGISNVTVDIGFTFEFSEITQVGDIENTRSFTYPKPTIAVTYSPSYTKQWRFRAERLVNQLDFFDFVSTSNFEDLDLDLGNPDLRPEQTWATSLVHEWRFGEIGVFALGAFYDKITDVEDLVPLGLGFESPGNIGDGERWGGKVNMTVPLSLLQLNNTRLDLTYQKQWSSVTDPVTGDDRELSGESDEKVTASFRKDVPRWNSAFGADYRWNAPVTLYGQDELVRQPSRSSLNLYAETTLTSGIKLRLDLINLLNHDERTTRTFYLGTRASGIVLFQEERVRNDDIWGEVSIRGVF